MFGKVDCVKKTVLCTKNSLIVVQAYIRWNWRKLEYTSYLYALKDAYNRIWMYLTSPFFLQMLVKFWLVKVFTTGHMYRITNILCPYYLCHNPAVHYVCILQCNWTVYLFWFPASLLSAICEQLALHFTWVRLCGSIVTWIHKCICCYLNDLCIIIH